MIYAVILVCVIFGIALLIWFEGRQYEEFKLKSQTEKEKNDITTKALKVWAKMDASFADKRKFFDDWLRKHVQGS